MNKLLAVLHKRSSRLNTVIAFVIAGIALALAASEFYEREQLHGIARDTMQEALPTLMSKQRTARNLDLLRHYGDAVAFDPHPEDRKRALDAARLLATRPALVDTPEAAPLVAETAVQLEQLAAAAGDRNALVRRWERLSDRIGAAADRIAAESAKEIERESDRIDAATYQAAARIVAILGAMALLTLLSLALRRRQAITEASLDDAELARYRIEGEKALLQLMADNTDAMIFAHSPDAADGYKLIYSNAAFARHLGRNRHEMSTLSVKGFSGLSGDELAAQMAELKRVKLLQFETEHKVRDGRRVPVEVKLNYIEHDGIPLVAGYCRDVTARRADEARLRALEVEAALRLHERRYKEFFDAFAEGIFMLDVDVDGHCAIAALNPAAERTIGIAGPEAQGKRAENIFPSEVAETLAAHERRCVDSGAFLQYEMTLDRPDGSRILEVAMVPLRDADGRIRRIAGIARDITERVGMERRLRDAAAKIRVFLDNIPDPAWIKDKENRYLAVNQAFVRHAGAEVPADIVGKLDLDYFPAHAALSKLAHDTQVVASGRQLRSEETGIDRDGHEFCFETIRSPLRDDAGNITGTVGISRDVTARVRMQALLAARERAFRSVAENIPGNIARYSLEARHVYLSPSFVRLVGCSLEDAIGKTPQECWPDGRFAVYQARVLAVARSGFDSELEMTLKTPDGTTQIQHIRFVAERDDQGGVAGVLALGMDITARRRMEDAIKAREREFRTLAENLPDNVVRYDRRCRVLYVSPAMVAGVAPNALPVLGAAPIETHPDIEAVAAYQRLLEEVMATGSPGELEMLVPHPGGETRTHHIRIVAERDGNGEVAGALAIGQDITERAAAEQALRKLNADWAATLEALPDMLCEADLDGICHQVWVQPPALLARHRQAMLGRRFAEHLPPDAAEAVMASLREANATGSSYGRQLRRSHRVDARWFELSVSRKAGNPADGPRFIILFRVITERKRLEAELMRREEEFRALAGSAGNPLVSADHAGA